MGMRLISLRPNWELEEVDIRRVVPDSDLRGEKWFSVLCMFAWQVCGWMESYPVRVFVLSNNL